MASFFAIFSTVIITKFLLMSISVAPKAPDRHSVTTHDYGGSILHKMYNSHGPCDQFCPWSWWLEWRCGGASMRLPPEELVCGGMAGVWRRRSAVVDWAGDLRGPGRSHTGGCLCGWCWSPGAHAFVCWGSPPGLGDLPIRQHAVALSFRLLKRRSVHAFERWRPSSNRSSLFMSPFLQRKLF